MHKTRTRKVILRGVPGRRGLAAVEWFAVVGGLSVMILWWGASFTSSLLGSLEETGRNTSDPSTLVTRMNNGGIGATPSNPGFGGSGSSSSGEGGSGVAGSSGGEGDSSSGGGGADSDKQKGNNGVGNGEDPAPPGNPPENDGAGTSPGNPGNKGGAKKK